MPSYYGRGKTLVSAPTTTGGTWANTANMVDGTGGVINATFGTWTSTTSGGTATAIFGNFEAPSVVAGESLVSLGCVVRHGFSNAARISSVTAQAMDNGVNIGSPVQFSISTAQTSDVVILPVTEAQLRSPTFQIKIVATRKSVTQSCVWSVDFVDLDIDTALPSPKAETLVDTFDTDDTVKWPTGLRYNNVVIAGGQVALTEMVAAYSGIATTANAYSLEDSYVFCKATVPAVQTNTTESTLSVYGPTNANGVFFILFKTAADGQQICMRRTIATVTDNAFLPYDPVAMAYIRVRKDAGTLYWDTSPDGWTWTNRRTLAGALNLGQVTIELSVGQWGTEATQSTGYFDNVNYAPPLPLTLDKSDSAGLTDYFTYVLAKPKTETLIDTFDASIDSKWTASGNAVWDAGRVRMTGSPTVSSAIVTPYAYDLTGSSIYVQSPSNVPTTSGKFSLTVESAAGHGARWDMWSPAPDEYYLRAYTKNAGVDTVRGTTYFADPKWWRIRESAGTVYFDTSYDGSTWTNRTSGATPAGGVNNVRVSVSYTASSGDAATQFHWDNVNTVPAQALTYAKTDNLALTDSVSRVQSSVYAKTDNLGLTDSVTRVETHPKIETFTDNFQTLDTTTKWSVTAGRVSLDAERLKFVTLPSASNYTYAVSRAAFDLRESSVMIEVVDVGNQTLPTFECMLLKVIDPAWSAEVGFNLNGNSLGVYNGVLLQPTTTFSAATRWLRIRETGGTVYYEYSATGAAGSWTVLTSHLTSAFVAPVDASAVRVLTGCGAWTAAEPASGAMLDNLNPPAGQALTLDKQDSLGITDTQTDAIALDRVDLAKPTDTVAAAAARTLDRSDGLGLTDAVSTAAAMAQDRSKTLNLTDSFTYSLGVVLDRADAISLTDSFTYVLTPGVAGTVGPLINYGQGGDWVTRGWGTAGYMLADNASSKSLPPGVTGSTTGTRYTWGQPFAHSSAMRLPPPDENSGQFCWYAPATFDLTFTFAQAWSGTLRAYCMSSADDVRSERLEMFLNGVSKNSIDLMSTDPATWFGSGVANPPMLPGGRWVGWDVSMQPGDVLMMTTSLLGGANVVVSGFLFDPIGAGTAYTRDVTDAVGLSDSISVGMSYARDVTDEVRPSDAVVTKAVSLARSDALALTDSRNLSITKALTDLVNPTDTVSGAAARTLDRSDTLGLTDSRSLAVGLSRSDLATPTDALTKSVTLARSDTTGLIDYATPLLIPPGIPPSVSGRPKVNLPVAGFVEKPGKVWTGSAWVEKPWKRWTGTEWKLLGGEVAFDPSDVAGLVTWLDAKDYTTGSWPNKGSGPAVTIPGTPAPTVSANTLNGLPLVRFKSNEGKVRSTWDTNPIEWTLVYLVRWVGPSPGRAFSVQYPPSNLLVGMHTSQPDTMYNNGTWVVYGTGWNGWTTGTTNPWRMYGADSTQSMGSRFFLDGVEIGTPVFNVDPQEGLYGGWGLSGYGAGPEETLDIEVAEVCLYNRKLSDAERQQVEGYLQEKWFGPKWDADTQAYLTATGLNESFAPALDGLVTGLKAKGLWSKMLAIYPFIGGTEALHKWNLKDPRDLDAAYRLTFTGTTSSHSTGLGYQANAAIGGGGYADTHFVPAGIQNVNSTHMSLYSLASKPAAARCDMGTYNWDGGTGRFHVIANYIGGVYYYSMGSTEMANAPVPNSLGLFTSTRTGANFQAGYRNGVQVGSSSSGVYSLPTVSMYIGALNSFPNEHSDLPFGFASFGSGLSPQENADLYDVVQTYQSALGRIGS